MNSQTLMETERAPIQTSPIWIIQKKEKKSSVKEIKKAIVLDSGTLINLSMNGLLYLIEELKKATGVRFFITKDVKYEVIDRPIDIPRFELGALGVKSLIESNVIELPESLEISDGTIKKNALELMEIANQSVRANGRWIKIVSIAEMSCLSLSRELSKKGFENIIAIDERTTRILAEKPENLEQIMSLRLHQHVELKKENFKTFSEFKFIRSTELAYVAYKKGLLKLSGPRALEAVLFATKYKGASVSFDEINELKKL